MFNIKNSKILILLSLILFVFCGFTTVTSNIKICENQISQLKTQQEIFNNISDKELINKYIRFLDTTMFKENELLFTDAKHIPSETLYNFLLYIYEKDNLKDLILWDDKNNRYIKLKDANFILNQYFDSPKFNPYKIASFDFKTNKFLLTQNGDENKIGYLKTDEHIKLEKKEQISPNIIRLTAGFYRHKTCKKEDLLYSKAYKIEINDNKYKYLSIKYVKEYKNEKIYIPDENFKKQLQHKLFIKTGLKIDTLTKKDLFKITDLNLENILDLDGIQYCINLYSLDIRNSGEQIANLDKIKKLGQLGGLTIINSDIKNILFIEEIDSLIFCDLSSNNISNLEPLKNLQNLAELNLSHNNISSFKPLTNIKTLKKLNLSDNNIADLTHFSKLKNLYVCDLSNNKIRSIDSLSELDKLYILFIQNNLITTLKPILNKNFISFNAENNPLLSPSELNNFKESSKVEIYE